MSDKTILSLIDYARENNAYRKVIVVLPTHLVPKMVAKYYQERLSLSPHISLANLSGVENNEDFEIDFAWVRQDVRGIRTIETEFNDFREVKILIVFHTDVNLPECSLPTENFDFETAVEWLKMGKSVVNNQGTVIKPDFISPEWSVVKEVSRFDGLTLTGSGLTSLEFERLIDKAIELRTKMMVKKPVFVSIVIPDSQSLTELTEFVKTKIELPDGIKFIQYKDLLEDSQLEIENVVLLESGYPVTWVHNQQVTHVAIFSPALVSSLEFLNH